MISSTNSSDTSGVTVGLIICVIENTCTATVNLAKLQISSVKL